jgi:hypothetical protein
MSIQDAWAAAISGPPQRQRWTVAKPSRVRRHSGRDGSPRSASLPGKRDPHGITEIQLGEHDAISLQ